MGPGSVNPLTVPRVIPNMPVCNAAIILGIHGPTLGVSAACTTGTHSIGIALGLLRGGMADVILAGGAESTLTPFVFDAYTNMGVLSTFNEKPEIASRPFDLKRDGFVMGEGAGVVVLESLEFALDRGAKILAELAGYGRTSDAYHITAPHAEGLGAIKAMELAIKDAGLKITDINYINAHGTSTKLNDQIETLAINKLFGEQARKIPVSSTNSMTGHLLGAAGGIELAACVLSIRDNMVHPTINYETPDPDCDLDYVPNIARKVQVNVALSNSLGFGGHNATLVVKRFIP
jgi:3-oxoacyl-[acyl-carrier-protein] synthase II